MAVPRILGRFTLPNSVGEVADGCLERSLLDAAASLNRNVVHTEQTLVVLSKPGRMAPRLCPLPPDSPLSTASIKR